MERIERTFVHFKDHIYQELGVYPADFIAFYEYADSLMNGKLNKALTFAYPEKWQEFTASCLAKGLLEPKDWIKEAPEEIGAYVKLISDPGYIVSINLDEIDEAFFSRDTFMKIAGLLSCEKSPDTGLLFYTQRGVLLDKPIYKIDDDNYLLFFHKHMLDASYRYLINFCKEENESIFKHRDKLLEIKAEELFKRFFSQKAFCYKNYYVDGKSEQDLLFLYKGLALIIECKASSNREPLRNPLIAYERLTTDFNNNIQYGYDQTYRVKSKFIEGKQFDVTDKNGNKLYQINPAKYSGVYSIVVTLDRFGMIQTDLSSMLALHEDDEYPLAINIDDLETILLVFAKQQAAIGKLQTYLKYREKYHEHLICDDELELCGLFLHDLRKFVTQSQVEEIVVMDPGFTAVIEKAYREGLGFLNERHYDAKIKKQIGYLYTE